MRPDLHPSLDRLTERIIGAAFTVSNTLGHGFLEVVYKRALMEEFTANALAFAVEEPFPIRYRNKVIGQYVADLVVEQLVVVELKALETLARAHGAQVLNYLKASRLPVGLLINFGSPRIQLKRIILPSVAIR